MSVHGAAELLLDSEDSNTLNTSFVEQHNLTIRQGCAYLQRKTSCHARNEECLDDSLALLQCYYNFIRPHLSLRFGDELRTPAMQGGLVSKRLSFREIFTSREIFFLRVFVIIVAWRMELNFRHQSYKLATLP
jgi:hypothetical protein